MAMATRRRPRSASLADLRAKWLERVCKLPAPKRIPAIDRRLRSLPKTPTTANVFFRKELLRLLDEARLEAGIVSPSELHRENSPFVDMDFRTARIEFGRRPRA
jgi:hypothetical protein